MATNANLIVTLYLLTMVFLFISIIAGGILIWFRKVVFDSIKLKKLMRRGYIIARLKRLDKTEIEVVVIPDKETNSVKFPNVEGLYTLDDASVILKNRSIPVYEWKEGETSPINFQLETISSKITCPECKKEFIGNIERQKSINPSVLDNVILKIKTLSQMAGINKLFLIIIIICGAIFILGIVDAFLIYDFKKRIGEILAPQIREACLIVKNAITV